MMLAALHFSASRRQQYIKWYRIGLSEAQMAQWEAHLWGQTWRYCNPYHEPPDNKRQRERLRAKALVTCQECAVLEAIQAAWLCQASTGACERKLLFLSRWSCVCAAPFCRVGLKCVFSVDTRRFNLITAGVMERKRGVAATDGLNRMEG